MLLVPTWYSFAASRWVHCWCEEMGTFLPRKDRYQDLWGNRSRVTGEPPSRGTLTDILSLMLEPHRRAWLGKMCKMVWLFSVVFNSVRKGIHLHWAAARVCKWSGGKWLAICFDIRCFDMISCLDIRCLDILFCFVMIACLDIQSHFRQCSRNDM